MEAIEQGTYFYGGLIGNFTYLLVLFLTIWMDTFEVGKWGHQKHVDRGGRCSSLWIDSSNGGMQLVNITKPT